MDTAAAPPLPGQGGGHGEGASGGDGGEDEEEEDVVFQDTMEGDEAALHAHNAAAKAISAMMRQSGTGTKATVAAARKKATSLMDRAKESVLSADASQGSRERIILLCKRFRTAEEATRAVKVEVNKTRAATKKKKTTHYLPATGVKRIASNQPPTTPTATKTKPN
jgi:hypothetical protein